MMFCRYCGANIADDSLFCAKCGKRLGARSYPRAQKVVNTLGLKTPYPYFIVLLAGFIVWTIGPRQSHADYSELKWNIEVDRVLDLRDENLFQQSLSLVVENTGSGPVQDIPIELSATIDPARQAEVVAGFLGRKLVIMSHGRPLPLVVVLGDTVQPGSKKRYFLEGSISAVPPFKVTYHVREEGENAILANHVVERE